MRMARTITASCITALLAGCAAQQDMGPVASGRPTTEEVADGSDVIVTTGSRQNEAVRNAPTHTSPPPPPPAPIVGKVAQEARIAPPGYRVPPVMVAIDPGRERYDGKEVSPVHLVRAEPVSTFSVDVDTGAYANTRRFLTEGRMPPRDAVRSEELINYFRYDYPLPDSRDTPFSITTDVAVTPWNPETRLMRIGLRGYDLRRSARPPANLVFLVDVSGSMRSQDKLPLVKTALSGLAGELGKQDRVSIVVYAGAAGLVLEPTSDERKIRAALDRLQAGGSTAGAAGLKLAYNIARDNFIDGGVNRILIATDGDFNVGVSDTRSLIEMIERERENGITLTTLGFGTGNYNEAMMEQIADHGNGNYAYIDSALEARKVLGEQMSSTLFTIAKDVKIQVEFNPAQVSQYRLLGYENRALREEDFDNDLVDAGDIGAGHQVTAIYEIVPAGAKGWIGPRRYDDPLPEAARGKAGELAFVKLRYKLPNGKASRLIERAVPAGLMHRSSRPTGDFAFATAVAAFGQTLRGDEMMNGFTFDQITGLARGQHDFWRQEFVRLVGVAESLKGG
ncbi:MAG: VWA domain-containing protein [Novosphingobium sp.]|nr:VWA domain-containing protein [Novosphingobium sp.]MCP5404301.1 VWA domain-containing protein [Novosphingobium sp.]